jgi:hypothetical protein
VSELGKANLEPKGAMDGSTTLDTLENIKASYAVTLQKIMLRR